MNLTQVTVNMRTASNVDCSGDRSAFMSYEVTFFCVRCTQTNTATQTLARTPMDLAPSGGQRKETQQRKCKCLMWDCWVTLQRKWIRLRGQLGLYCEKELICLDEWVSAQQSAGSRSCGRPQDLPVGANPRMRHGNLNSHSGFFFLVEIRYWD